MHASVCTKISQRRNSDRRCKRKARFSDSENDSILSKSYPGPDAHRERHPGINLRVHIHEPLSNPESLCNTPDVINEFNYQVCDCEVSAIPDMANLADEFTSENRSGSWAGVNESEEDLKKFLRQNSSTSGEHIASENVSHRNILPTSSAQQYLHSEAPRYQNSYGSNFESTLPNSYEFISDVEKLRRRLKFFFMNPIEKWHAKKRLPWKLLIQIIKIIICTVQLCVFASQRYSHVTYLWDTKISFSHLFIKCWDASREVTAYPPATGPLALYTRDEFYDFVDYTVNTFSSIGETSIGDYSYIYVNGNVAMPEFCLSQYVSVDGRSDVQLAEIDFISNKCLTIPLSALRENETWSTRKFLSTKNISINFGFLIDASFSFSLKTFKLTSTSSKRIQTPECYSLETSIYFDNSDHDGQMLVELDIGAEVLDCEGPSPAPKLANTTNYLQTLLNILTICICAFSFIMCLRALYRAQILRAAVNDYFKVFRDRVLSRWEKFEFLNLWYVLICVNDVMIVVGSIMKMSLEGQKHNFASPKLKKYKSDAFDYEGYLDKWNVCSLLLGTGNMFIWFGCLRYLGFFETYNVLILTFKSCFPNVLRYSICILMVFSGYSLCGWLVLGPYHLKFRSLSTTAECLYSLINGDDMFATFSSTIGKDAIVWWFSRIYLYSFCSLFIYVILSLFIAIITDAYETIKRYYEEGFPTSDLVNFANACQADPQSGVFHDDERTIQDIVNHICCCCPRMRPSTAGDYEEIRS